MVAGLAFSDDRPPLPGLVVGAVVAAGAFALMSSLFRPDDVAAGLDASGWLEVTDDGIGLHLPAVLADRVEIPWAAVSGIVVDDGLGRGFAYDTPSRRRHLLDDARSGIAPHHRPPLASTLPVRPNVLVLLDDPLVLPWAHPSASGPLFHGAGEAGAWALPWTSPRPTPAFWVRLREPAALGVTVAAPRLRELTAEDVRRLRSALGDLPEVPPHDT